MKIEGNTIIFKSTPDNYFKECTGLKSCTIRRISLWSEMKNIEEFYEDYVYINTNVKIKSISSKKIDAEIVGMVKMPGKKGW